MRELHSRELAQRGLQYIEDAIVGLLTRHSGGMPKEEIAEALGLRTDLAQEHRDLVIAGILELLVKSGRIIWDEKEQIYKDNPERL